MSNSQLDQECKLNNWVEMSHDVFKFSIDDDFK